MTPLASLLTDPYSLVLVNGLGGKDMVFNLATDFKIICFRYEASEIVNHAAHTDAAVRLLSARLLESMLDPATVGLSYHADGYRSSWER